jgi:hypothetical protein
MMMLVKTKNLSMRVLHFMVVSLLFIGCEKNGENNTGDLTSGWKETDHYYSIGGPVEWHRTESQNAEIIEFRKDSVFYSSVYTKVNRYKIETIAGSSSAKLKLYEEGKTDTTYWFVKEVTQNNLIIGVSGCIEGCGKKFVRVEGN